MAKLSGKQQAILERKWALEAASHALDVQMADAIRGMVAQKKALNDEINALESQVPESVQDAWDAVDSEHPSFPDDASSETWLAARWLVQKA